jgi:hypothetical protein
MERSMFTDAEIQLVRERGLKYQGTAKINLNQIVLHLSASRELTQKLWDDCAKFLSGLAVNDWISAIMLAPLS